MTLHKGSCLCGAVAFTIKGDLQAFFLCHCSRCRKVSGSAHAANLFAPDATITWESGEKNARIYSHPETRFGRSFCCECGGALPRKAADGKSLVIPAGCLDTPVEINPTAHIFTASRANWDHDLETVPMYDELPK
ncbi:GFA family protein [Rhodobacterales bacterium]|nr:GFA family protein [Rhodobacterales bacterium]